MKTTIIAEYLNRKRRLQVPAAAMFWALAWLLPVLSYAADDAALDTLLQDAVSRGRVFNVVAIAGTSQGVSYANGFGPLAAGDESRVGPDTRFRIASMTKALTSVAAMQLVEKGELGLDDPVSDYLPSFAELQVLEGFNAETGEPSLREPRGAVTVRHLLTHTAGFGYEVWNERLLQAVETGLMPGFSAAGDAVLDAPLVFDPGTVWHYGINTDWLGRLVATVSGKPLDKVFAEQLFAPLAMQRTGFVVDAADAAQVSSVFARLPDGGLAPLQIPAPSAETVSFMSGGGGLVSTAQDYARFLMALLNGGELDGTRILNRDTVKSMGQNHIGELEAGAMQTVMPQFSNSFDFFPGVVDRFGLGFLINSQPVTGGRSAGSLSWAGLYNSYYWLDPESDVFGILLTQVLPFADPTVLDLFADFERAVYAAKQQQAEH